LPDSLGAGAGRLPPLLGRPEGQNEMAVDLKDVDLKDVDLKDVDPKSPPARQKRPQAAGLRLPGRHKASLIAGLNDRDAGQLPLDQTAIISLGW